MSQIKNKKFQTIALVLGIATIAILGGISSFGNENITEAQEPSATPDTKELSGYAWSSNVGWISMNCSNTGTCLTSKYGVTLDEETGDLTGEAWSSNVGWLQFGGYNTTDFPVDSSTQSINANIDTDNGSMNGWARFLGFGDDRLMEMNNYSDLLVYAQNPTINVQSGTFDTEMVIENNTDSSITISGISRIKITNPTNTVPGPGDSLTCIESLDGAWYDQTSYGCSALEPGMSTGLCSLQESFPYIVSPFDDDDHYILESVYKNGYIPVSENDVILNSGEKIIVPGGSFYDCTRNNYNSLVSNIVGEVEGGLLVTSVVNPVNNAQLAWDGWVSLSGLSTDDSTYGVSRTEDTLSGYAWGDDVVGWIDFSGVSLSESPAQCGTANAINISTKPVTDFCDTGTLSGVVSQADQDSWTWTCLNESSSAQCGASCSINEWICGDECISTSETCGNNVCPIGKIEQPVGSGTCEVDTGSCPAGQIEDPSNPGVCIENTGSYNGDITAFIAQPRIINSGEECSLNWAVYTEDASSVLCEVVPDGGDTIKIDPEDGNLGNVKSGTVKYENVTSSTNYTMSCYGAVGGDGPTIKTKTSTLLSEETAKCIINPTFREF